jgi:GTP-binding protein HflX
MASPEREKHAATTLQVLQEIGAGDRPVITVLNKADLRTDPLERAEALAAHPGAILVSSATGEGVGELLARLETAAASKDLPMTLLIPHDQYALLSRLHREATVLTSAVEDEGTRVEAVVPARLQDLCRPWARGE